METTTPFDLNRAIQQWREDLAQSPAIRSENLDELETHLRDSVTTLQARDLSAEEAFFVATKRVGNGAVLVKEFGKVNGVNVWVERFLWALIAMQIWMVIRNVIMALSLFLQLTRKTFPSTYHGLVDAFSLLLFSAIPLLVTALIVWRLFQSPQGRVGRLLENLSNRPATVALLFFVLSFGADIFNTFSMNYVNHLHGSPTNVSYGWFLPGCLMYSALIFILARRRLLRKA